MTPPFGDRPVNVVELARLVLRDAVDLDDWMLYVRAGTSRIAADTACRVGAFPTITEADEEVFPDFVRDDGLEVLCHGPQFVDVVRHAARQLGEPSAADLVKALNQYVERDDFLDVRHPE